MSAAATPPDRRVDCRVWDKGGPVGRVTAGALRVAHVPHAVHAQELYTPHTPPTCASPLEHRLAACARSLQEGRVCVNCSAGAMRVSTGQRHHSNVALSLHFPRSRLALPLASTERAVPPPQFYAHEIEEEVEKEGVMMRGCIFHPMCAKLAIESGWKVTAATAPRLLPSHTPLRPVALRRPAAGTPPCAARS